MKQSQVKFNPEALRKTLLKNLTEQQTQLLIDYAKEKIRLLGDSIMLYNSRNHMDRTGNLLDSLCWGVSYDGKLAEGGFYRDATARGASYLHEWLSGDVKYLLPVSGHQLAEQYLNSYGNNGAKGWKVFFAILAPYWGYWEKGFTQIHGLSHNPKYKHNAKGIIRGATFQQFAVMTQFYDVVRQDLKPARTRFRVSVAKYNRQNLEKRWERYDNTGK